MKNRIGWATLALAVVTMVTPITASARDMDNFRNVDIARVDADRYNQDHGRFDRDEAGRDRFDQARMDRGHHADDGRRFADRDRGR